jgi:hypothetical protein
VKALSLSPSTTKKKKERKKEQKKCFCSKCNMYICLNPSLLATGRRHCELFPWQRN